MNADRQRADRQTPEQYAQEVFDTLLRIGSDYASAMREARLALTEARLDAGQIACPEALAERWTR